ncbi:SMP-30/gluconolactonase/LRE family protein [Brachybacterium sp. DNPG3]
MTTSAADGTILPPTLLPQTLETPTSPLLAEGARLELVATGARWAEGPVWLARRRAVRYSDILGNRILEFSEETGETTVFAEDVMYTNGRTLDLQGMIVTCSHGKRSIQRDRAVRPGDVHRPRELVEKWDGHRFNSPNDVIVASDGAIWFTDPSYGIHRPGEGYAGYEEYGDRYVFRYDESTSEVRPVVIDVEAPNGLALSPDETLLYVADSSASPSNPDRAASSDSRPRGHALRVYDLVEGRHAKNGRVLVEVSPGVPDGLKVDAEGRIWCSSESGVQVFSPAGERLLDLPVPERTANLCFGGDDGTTLYITATTGLYRIATTTRDATTVARAGSPLGGAPEEIIG